MAVDIDCLNRAHRAPSRKGRYTVKVKRKVSILALGMLGSLAAVGIGFAAIPAPD
jgi:hypothetical protein